MKQNIINRFNDKVRGKIPDTENANQRHDGRGGHWLERQMGIDPNGRNEADLFGYEMKNETTSGKITFGDWSADEYIYLHGRGRKINSINSAYKISRDDFLKIFGKPNPYKNNRYSWSGTPCPTYYNQTTPFGQTLTIDTNDDIIITYNYSKDERLDKSKIVPINMQIDNLIIAKWHKASLKHKLERKFNQNGWFTCSKDADGAYAAIHFGAPMNYNSWISLFKKRVVFFDSGMYETNLRPYSQWRASRGFWHSLITDTY